MTPKVTEPAGVPFAYWAAFVLFLAAVTIGLGWDRQYHITHEFDSFFSPPHIFIYATSLLATLAVGVMLLFPARRARFGGGLKLAGLDLPPSLVFLLAAFLMPGFSGLVLDNFWHTAFGLDETAWSFPHAMLGWSFFLTLLGFFSARLALRKDAPLRWYSTIFYGFLLLGFSVAPFLGPFNNNHTLETVEAISKIPVLLNQDESRRVFAIYQTWNLTRTNSAFLLFAAVWAGASLALVRRVAGSHAMLIAIVSLWTVLAAWGGLRAAVGLGRYFGLELAADGANWLPPPILMAALLLAALLAWKLPEDLAWLLAGWAFGLAVVLIWRPQPAGLLVALLVGPLTILGARIGQYIYHVLENPARNDGLWLLVAGVGAPFITGLIDLVLRNI